MTNRLAQPHDLAGERGLLAAVVLRALKDAGGRDPEQRSDAWRYLGSDVYRHHVECLGMASDAMPAEVTRWAQQNGC